MADDPDPPTLSLAAMARLAGIRPATMRGYKRRGLLPDPDGEPIPGRPLWRQSTYQKWKAKWGRRRTSHTPPPEETSIQ